MNALQMADQLEVAAQMLRDMQRDLDRAVCVSQYMIYASKLPEGRDKIELNKDIFSAAIEIVGKHGEFKE